MIRFRLHAAPTRPLPLNVRSAGHYDFVAGKRELREAGRFLQLFWCVAGSGRFKVGSTVHRIKPGLVFYYAAGEPHDLTAGADGWEYRWVTFDGAHFERITRDYSLARVQFAGPCPGELFERLDAALRDPTADGELHASILGYEILLRATSPQPEPAVNEPPAPAALAAKEWLDAHFTDARLNVAALAARLGLHRSSLHRVFTRHYGVAPVQYLARLRLRRALELLTNSGHSVADVAVRCGLPDVAHFSKLVSRHTSFSPRAYRRRHAHATKVGPT